MAKKCPNCETVLMETADKPNEAYCEKCDMTYHLHKGKVSFDPSKKGKIQELEENLAETNITLEKVIKKLFGEDEKDIWDD